MELTPRDLTLIIWFNTHGEWSKEVAIDWLEGFIGVASQGGRGERAG